MTPTEAPRSEKVSLSTSGKTVTVYATAPLCREEMLLAETAAALHKDEDWVLDNVMPGEAAEVVRISMRLGTHTQSCRTAWQQGGYVQ